MCLPALMTADASGSLPDRHHRVPHDHLDIRLLLYPSRLPPAGRHVDRAAPAFGDRLHLARTAGVPAEDQEDHSWELGVALLTAISDSQTRARRAQRGKGAGKGRRCYLDWTGVRRMQAGRRIGPARRWAFVGYSDRYSRYNQFGESPCATYIVSGTTTANQAGT